MVDERTLPPLQGVELPPGEHLKLPALSFAFYVLKRAAASVCWKARSNDFILNIFYERTLSTSIARGTFIYYKTLGVTFVYMLRLNYQTLTGIMQVQVKITSGWGNSNLLGFSHTIDFTQTGGKTQQQPNLIYEMREARGKIQPVSSWQEGYSDWNNHSMELWWAEQHLT